MARQVAMLTALVKNLTDPSIMQTLTPPVWLLPAVIMMRLGGNMQERLLGSPECQ